MKNRLPGEEANSVFISRQLSSPHLWETPHERDPHLVTHWKQSEGHSRDSGYEPEVQWLHDKPQAYPSLPRALHSWNKLGPESPTQDRPVSQETSSQVNSSESWIHYLITISPGADLILFNHPLIGHNPFLRIIVRIKEFWQCAQISSKHMPDI